MREIFDYFDAPVEIISGKDILLLYAVNLEKLAVPTLEEVINGVKKVLYSKN